MRTRRYFLLREEHRPHPCRMLRRIPAVRMLQHIPVVRNTYRALFNRKSAIEYANMRALYRKFIRKGDLVFDVGANVGEYAGVFSELGAIVIAVEPNPTCCKSLYEIARSRGIRVEGCAVGDKPGSALLHPCSETYFSTLNGEWLERTKSESTYSKVQWMEPFEVPVTTIDSLVRRHGQPKFIKIDVEGFEARVLRGMTFRPDALSFEFSAAVRNVALECIDLLPEYQFNAIEARSFDLIHPQWITSKEARRWLAAYSGNSQYGDVFARISTRA
jgi:FkbM family methyltransferase